MINITYEQLTFSNDFMFCKILQNNPDLCRELLELILGVPVGAIVETENQKSIEITADGKGVRFDVYAKDDNSTVYDIEMQNAMRDHLPKRVRYAQSLIDLDLLEKGAAYSKLNKSYVIFICNFKLFEKEERHRYSFRNICLEDKNLELCDETEKIFLCTKGDGNDVSEEMRSFLAYVAGGAPSGGFTNRLEEAVIKARTNPRWRKEYMDFRDHLEMAKEEGREEERKNTEREKQRADAAEAEVARLKAELEEFRK